MLLMLLMLLSCAADAAYATAADAAARNIDNNKLLNKLFELLINNK